MRLSGIDCADCIAAIEAGVGRIAGVTSARASLVTQQLRVAFDAQATSVAAVMATVRALGYGAEPVAVEASSSAVRPEVPGCSQPGPQGFRAFVRTDRQAWSAGLAGLLVAIGAALAWSPTPAWVGKAALGGAVAIAGLPI
ncbi:MAG: cation transporter, partial [Actinobacteria bacterium]|nr:cation transporter [Actinomycetota bacterium]